MVAGVTCPKVSQSCFDRLLMSPLDKADDKTIFDVGDHGVFPSSRFVQTRLILLPTSFPFPFNLITPPRLGEL